MGIQFGARAGDLPPAVCLPATGHTQRRKIPVNKEEWDVEFAAEILRRENEGQVTKPHKGRFDQNETKPKIEEKQSKSE